jgi:hypothetical protein
MQSYEVLNQQINLINSNNVYIPTSFSNIEVSHAFEH